MRGRGMARTYIRIAALLLAALSGGAASQERASLVFDHFTTAFRLDGAHQFVACEGCHVDGAFAGTPLQCSGCHAQGTRVRATSQPIQHVRTTEFCDSCHRTAGWVPVIAVDHVEVFGTCSSCHDGGRALGKPAAHLPTSNQCDDCHRTAAFSPAAFDHVGIASGCFGCHNGTAAFGKPADHIPATNVCEDCHGVMSFSPVGRVDHTQVLGVCSGCHNNVIAMGQFAGHIATGATECDACHSTTAWDQQ
jgi:hypothetical protein